MDIKEYQNEISKLTSDTKSVSVDADKTIVINSPIKKTTMIGILQYSSILIVSFLLLLVVKPKVILKLHVTGRTVSIVVNKKRFFILWLIMSAVLCLTWFLLSTYYFKKNT